MNKTKQKNCFTLEEIKIITAEMLIHFQDNLVAKNVCSIDLEADYNKIPMKIELGDTLEFNTNNFDKELSAKIKKITIEEHFYITCELGKKELQLDFEQFSKKVVQPISHALAKMVDSYILSKILECKNVYLSDDFFGYASGDGSKYIEAMKKEANLQKINTNFFCLIDYYTDAFLNTQKWFVSAQNRKSDNILNSSEIGTFMDLNFYSSAVFPSYTDDNGCKYHGSILSNSNLGLVMPLLNQTNDKASWSITDNGLSLKTAIYEEDGIKKLLAECMVGSFLINSDNMVLLGEKNKTLK